MKFSFRNPILALLWMAITFCPFPGISQQSHPLQISVNLHGGHHFGQTVQTGFGLDRLSYGWNALAGGGLHARYRVSHDWGVQAGVYAENITHHLNITTDRDNSNFPNPTIPFENVNHDPALAFPVGISYQQTTLNKIAWEAGSGLTYRLIADWAEGDFGAGWQNEPLYMGNIQYTVYHLSTWLSGGFLYKITPNHALRLNLLAGVGMQNITTGQVTMSPTGPNARTGRFQTNGNHLALQFGYVFTLRTREQRQVRESEWKPDVSRPENKGAWSVGLEAGPNYRFHRAKNAQHPIGSIFSPILESSLNIGWQIKPGWRGEFGWQVWLPPVSSVGVTIGNNKIWMGEFWNLPTFGGYIGASRMLLSPGRFRLYATTRLGVMYFPAETNFGWGDWRSRPTNPEYFRIIADPIQLRSLIPYAGIGIRPEFRLVRSGRLWTYAHLTANQGFLKAMSLNLTYWTDPSETETFQATSAFSGTSLNITWGIRLFLGK
jgi:hypothetical protein